MEIPPLPNPYGFINGAQAVIPNSGEVSYIGNGPMRCSQRSGSQLLEGGADILLGNAILPPTACIQAMAEQNVNGFGMFGDKQEKAPQEYPRQ